MKFNQKSDISNKDLIATD